MGTVPHGIASRTFVSNPSKSQGITTQHLCCVENGETSDEPINIIASDAPVACVLHTKRKRLLNQRDWKQSHGEHFTKANEAKIGQHFSEPKCKCGIEVPKNFKDAVCFDGENDNAPCQDSINLRWN